MKKIGAIALAAMMGVASVVSTAQRASAADLGGPPPMAPVAPAEAAAPGFDPIWVVVGAVGVGLLVACVADWCEHKVSH
jgi:hypothetical protein